MIRKIIQYILLGSLILSSIGASADSQSKTNTLRTTTETYDMIIIAPETFSTHIQPFIDYKNNHDVKTCLLTIQEIYKKYQGRDAAEQVKYAIRDAKEQWNISYVLLIGGLKFLGVGWHVPVRYSQLDDESGNSAFLTDLYFADLYKENGEFDDWDSNGNGIIAEWGKDTLDLTPDVAIGRLPCRTTREVDNVVGKIITYETQTDGSSWFHRMVAIGGDSFPAFEGFEGEATCDVATSYMTDFTIEKLYISTGKLTGPTDIITAVNQGCGFVLTRGKGGQDRIRMGLPEGSELIALQNKHVSKFTNKNQYPICVLGECIHGKFDVCIRNIPRVLQNITGYSWYDCIYECIAWKLVVEKNAGMIATLTNTNICYGAPGDSDENGIPDDAEQYGGFLAVELFRLYSQEGIQTLGALHQQALTNYVNLFPVHTDKYNCKSVQEFILLGDPSLHIGGYQ